jgi:PIN domain nuclease of toxin-antitoxin system
MSAAVLDASALLAYLQDEQGAQPVAEAIARGATICAVNLAEVFSRVADRGGDALGLSEELIGQGLLGRAVTVQPFTVVDAVEVARLRPMTRHLGLSLGDRACLALAKRLAVDVLTADTDWTGLDVGVRLQQIR